MTALRLAAMASRRADAFSSAVEGGFGFGVGFAIAFRRIPARARRTPPCFDLEARLFFCLRGGIGGDGVWGDVRGRRTVRRAGDAWWSRVARSLPQRREERCLVVVGFVVRFVVAGLVG